MQLGAPRNLFLRLFGGVLGRFGDAELERRFGLAFVQRLTFAAMTRSFAPDAAEGFQGSVVFELTRPATDGASAWWTVQVSGSEARASPGPDDGPGGERDNGPGGSERPRR